MSCLFTYDRVKGVIVHPEAVQLTDHIKLLSPQEQLFLLLWLDYHSIFSQHPTEERLRKALRKVFGSETYDHTTNPHMAEAIQEYKYCQYDSLRETERVYIDKLKYAQDEFTKETNFKKIGEIEKAIASFSNKLIEIRQQIDRAEADKRIRGDIELSLVEKWMERMEKKRQEDQKKKSDLTTQKIG